MFKKQDTDLSLKETAVITVGSFLVAVMIVIFI